MSISFEDAVTQLQTMFPALETDVIVAVLESNGEMPLLWLVPRRACACACAQFSEGDSRAVAGLLPAAPFPNQGVTCSAL